MIRVATLNILFFTVLFFSGWNFISAQESTPDTRGYTVSVGDQAPTFSIVLDNGDTVQTKDLLGKVVMLQFTASWCGVCRKEMPFIENEIWQIHKNKDFIIIGVDRDEPLEKVLQLKEQTEVTYPIGLDPDADIFGLFANKKSGVTRNVIIDKEGKIIMLTRLFNQNEFSEMKEVIYKALEQDIRKP